ncbi:hypothetical protein, partial [Vibrio parahaemolyticus]|uniref:hypothetical protein n=1 Tax=Vibrio parahaemolyticus TaxID=670 RepID=UPI0021112B9F
MGRIVAACVATAALAGVVGISGGAVGAAPNPDPRVVGGGDAAPGQYPFVVALVHHEIASDYEGQFCGDTVVA